MEDYHNEITEEERELMKSYIRRNFTERIRYEICSANKTKSGVPLYYVFDHLTKERAYKGKFMPFKDCKRKLVRDSLYNKFMYEENLNRELTYWEKLNLTDKDAADSYLKRI